jgi:hypothetical protein
VVETRLKDSVRFSSITLDSEISSLKIRVSSVKRFVDELVGISVVRNSMLGLQVATAVADARPPRPKKKRT